MAENFSQIDTFKDLVDEPDRRFHKFFESYCDVSLNPSFNIDKYLRSSKEMIRMANVYFAEHDYFYAFVIYSRFVVLYLQKIKEHPQFSLANKTELSTINKNLRTIALPRAEKLKVYIKEVFAQEAKRHKEEASSKAAASAPQDSAPISLNDHDLDALKRKYNTENEEELRHILERERRAAADSSADLDVLPGPSSAAEDWGAAVDPGVERRGTPSFDRSLKPGSASSLKRASSNKYNLRKLSIPADLTRKFLEMAEYNTKKKVETCGILAGKLSYNVFVISHCIIPKQHGNSDTCNTEQEHELFDAIDSLNLITLGWIHTHPSQTAFLSSIDLHTHYSYQLMIPEAVAIVCAPSFNETGVFILNPTYGMKEIADCRKNGFHPHTTNPPLFEDCDHAEVDDKLRAEMIDLRVKLT